MIKANYFDKTIFLRKETSEVGGSFNYDMTVYEADKLRNFAEMIKDKSVLLDVGSSTGSYSLLPLIYPNLTVWSFEPCHSVFNILYLNLWINKLSTERIRNLAMSNYIGRGVFNEVVEDKMKALSMLGGKPATHKNTVQRDVEVDTIDHFCEVNGIVPDAIKIDTEGNELNVLKGAARTILDYRPIIQVEYSQENANQYGYNITEIKEFLFEFGYEIDVKDGDLICK